jgi:hypothetical protein
VFRIVAILSICCLTFPGLYNLTNFVDYAVNTQKYLDSCENAEEPEVQCNGMCQLVDDLVNADTSEQEEQATLTISEIPFFLVPSEALTPAPAINLIKFDPMIADLQDEYIPACFHPPCA